MCMSHTCVEHSLEKHQQKMAKHTITRCDDDFDFISNNQQSTSC